MGVARRMNNDRIYAVRNTKTGKLVSNLGSRHKKYWTKKEHALEAIKNSYRYCALYYLGGLKIVEFALVEVESK